MTTSAGGRANLVFRSTSTDLPTYWGAILDDVSVSTPTVTSAVPESASWAMLIGGFGMIGGVMRRRAPHRPAMA